MLDKGDIELYAFLYAGIGEAVGNAYFDSVAFPCDPSHIGEVILVIGVLDMGNEFSPFSCEVSAPPEQISGGAHIGRINIGHGHHAAPKQGCYLICVYFVVLGFAAMDGFHIESMAKDEGNILFTAEIGEPVPGEDALNGNYDVLTIWRDRLEKDVGVCLDVPMQDDLSFLVEDAKVHSPCVKIDTAVKFVLLDVKSHLRPPFGK